MDPTGVLGPKWILHLTQQLTKLRKSRREEIDRLNDLFHVDPEVLARRYVEPDVQTLNPLEHRGEATPSHAEPRPVHKAVNRFLDNELEKKDGRHVLLTAV